VRRDELVQRARELYAVFAGGDRDAYADFFDEHVVWHVPGDNPVSGVYRGHDEYLREREDAAVLVAFQVSGQRKGQRVDTAGYHMIRFGADGRVVEGWGFTADQDSLDRFFSA
jgi:ketosteroid isomerase-like protein